MIVRQHFHVDYPVPMTFEGGRMIRRLINRGLCAPACMTLYILILVLMCALLGAFGPLPWRQALLGEQPATSGCFSFYRDHVTGLCFAVPTWCGSGITEVPCDHIPAEQLRYR